MANLNGDLEFFTGLQERGIKLIDPETKQATRYVIREMPPKVRNAYLDEIHLNNLSIDQHGNVRVKRYEGLSEALLTRAMFHDGPDGKNITPEELEAFDIGSSAVQQMVDVAKELSGLIDRQPLKDKAKN